MSKLDTDYNPEQASIQGVWNTPCNNKETQWAESSRDRHQVQHIGVEAVSLPILRRAALTSATQIMYKILTDMSTGD